MTKLTHADRRTVLRTLGAGVAGGALLTGRAGAHGEHWFPCFFETQLWELTARPPAGEEPTDEESHAPIWHLKPGVNGCAQVPPIIDWSFIEDGTTFKKGKWGRGQVPFDQTAAANPFTTLWHVHWVFDDGASKPYEPDDLVHEAAPTVEGAKQPLTSGSRIRNAESLGNVVIEDVAFVFNCPIRPAQGDHRDYCD